MPKVPIRFALLTLFIGTLAFAQTPNLEPRRPDNPAVATVTYTFDWPSIQPHHYSIAVDSTGRAAYESLIAEGTAAQSVEGEPYDVKFAVSEATRNRIFDLAKRLNYFNGNFDFKKHKVAFSGTKTLAFADGDKKFQTAYNWSENPEIQELTEIFTGISNTQESGRRLQQLRRYDKLGLNQELQRMEDLSKNHGLAEIQSIAPLLQELASDPAVMNIARERAQRLLRLAQRQAGGQ
jgi:hypothetical protein